MEEVLVKVQEDEDSLVNEIEEMFRLGKYSNDKNRPLKIRFKSHNAAEEAVAKAWKLAKVETYKQVYISKDRNVEERNKIKELREEAKKKTR